jgi:hypothetical protein
MSSRNSKPDDNLMPEADFSNGVRGKHYQAYRQGHSVTTHKTDGTTQNYLAERAKRGSLQDLKQILAKVPNIEPEEFDQF